MRARVLALLLVAVSVVPLHARAATPISVTAVNAAGQAVVWSKNTFVIKAKATSLPVKVQLTCLQVEQFDSSLVPAIPLSATQVNASVKAGGETYYVMFQSFANRGNKAVQAVTALGINKNAAPSNPCGSNPNLTYTAGIAIYR